jgi:hypothetical protein
MEAPLKRGKRKFRLVGCAGSHISIGGDADNAQRGSAVGGRSAIAEYQSEDDHFISLMVLFRAQGR